MSDVKRVDIREKEREREGEREEETITCGLGSVNEVVTATLTLS